MIGYSFCNKQNMSEQNTTLMIEWDFENDDVSEITDGNTDETYDFDNDYDNDNDYDHYECFCLSDEDRTTELVALQGKGSQGKP